MLNKLLKKVANPQASATENTVLQPELIEEAYPYSKDHLCQFIPHYFEALPEKRAQYDRVWAQYHASHREPSDPMRVLYMQMLLDIANNVGEKGEYGEFGTHRGFLAKVISEFMDKKQKFYIFDTFEGFKEKDLVEERKVYGNNWQEGNFLPTSVDMVRDYINPTSPENLILTKGWFPESFQGFEDIKWRFVHLDFDLYAPIKSGMEILWPQLLPGGVMVIHDYGCFGFPGVKKAVHEFFDPLGITPFPMPDRWGSVVVIKNK